ncbi:hypothetical protein B0182_01405 [Moraxella bovis]|nr:hypothetical protein DQF64_07130 [Moraxella bovis]OOR92124.1 hypothetical protein B0182_01405 [Moraxella bovis]
MAILGNLTVFLPAGRLRANGKPSSAYFLDYYQKFLQKILDLMTKSYIIPTHTANADTRE